MRRLAFVLLSAAFGAVALALALYVMRARAMPDLKPWHEQVIERDYRAGDPDTTLGDYLSREARIFRSLERFVAEASVSAQQLNRFVPDSLSNPARFTPNWNRTFVLPQAAPRGAALLLHGLSDSPYSLRALGEHLHARGFYVVGLRLPGHGTTPGALARARWRDWRAAVALAARDVAEHAAAGPFLMLGYSNGAALAADYTLHALETGGRPPARLILFSPALGVSRAAGLARFQRWLARLPGLHKLGWTDVLPEYDPYKYNSFPIEAGEQIYDLTQDVRKRIDRLPAAGGAKQLPPVLAFQSMVDATIPADAIVVDWLDRVPSEGSEVVLFDVNHMAAAEDLMRPGPASLLRLVLNSPPRSYDVSLITNADEESPALVARTRRAGEEDWRDAPLELDWPAGVYSLSHVALPFPPDDPIYGAQTQGAGHALRLGTVELRGERNVLVVSAGQLMRLRHNPFFSYVVERVDASVDAALARATAASP